MLKSSFLSLAVARLWRNPTREFMVQLHSAADGWKSIVGLEIHAQILSPFKIFSRAPSSFDSLPNTTVQLFDVAIPGSLPVLSESCVKAALKTALALSCRINRRSLFDRKHYFYYDLPAGYQITQSRIPVAVSGEIFVPSDDWTSKKRVRVRQLHLEHDSGRVIVDEDTGQTLVDLNRSGVGLMEIVTEPDLTCGREVLRFVKELRSLLLTIGTCDANSAEGSLRVDANVSVHGNGSPGTVTEIKNVGKPRLLERAVDYEIKRQVEVLQLGKEVVAETRAFNAKKGITVPVRGKGPEKHDYRFMPEPDIPPLVVSESLLETVKLSLPVLPATQRQSLVEKYGISLKDSAWLIEHDARDYFVETVNLCPNVAIPLIAKWTVGPLAGLHSKTGNSFKEAVVSPTQYASLLRLISREAITSLTANRVLAEMANSDDTDANDAESIVEERGWWQMVDDAEIEAKCDAVLAQHSENALKLQDADKAGRKALAFLMGRVLDDVDGRVNPRTLREALLKRVAR
eukprot:m.3611 g.3611  ORF g.3611 m.3611 type:complete len:516 (+) comp9629_c0_seq1:29-1576(+)